MGYQQLNIKKPCSEPLENISDGNGKFCPSCKHVVHDFSEMSTPELVIMLQSKKYSCGIFDKKQLGTLYYLQDESRSTRKKYWNGIAAAIVAGTLQFTSAYSQHPVGTEKLYPRSMAFEKFQAPKSETIVPPDNTSIKKEKFDFTILEEGTNNPLSYVKVVIMGISGLTDENGKISYDLPYDPDTLVRFTAELSLYHYEDEHIKLKLQSCYKKMTVMYMRQTERSKKREIVYGFF